MIDCVFCRIISKEIKVEPVKETSDILVIKDINPKAPIHYLIIPKKHFSDLRDLSAVDSQLASQVLLMTGELSRALSDADFRLISNNGKSVGQSVFHSHFHFLSGKNLEEF